MKRQHTAEIAATLTDAMTRRGALRFLAAAVMGSAGIAALGGVSGEAKKKRGKKGKKPGNGLCGRDRKLAELKVLSDGSIVQTPVLEPGRSYRLRVSGAVTGTTSLQAPVGIDAGYIFTNGGPQFIAHDVFAEVNYGLAVDGAAASWGDYAANHVYERVVEGNGERLALRLVTGPESALPQSTGQMTARAHHHQSRSRSHAQWPVDGRDPLRLRRSPHHNGTGAVDRAGSVSCACDLPA